MTREAKAAQAFVRSAPKLNKKDEEAFNALFPAYLFRRSATREVWTTCCHRHKKLPLQAKMSQAEIEAWHNPHQPEPRNSYCPKTKPSMACPFCGAPVIVKELRFTGQRQNLYTFRRALILKWDGKDLWALGYTGDKDYQDKDNLTSKPKMRLLGVARFRPGSVEAVSRSWWYTGAFTSISRQSGELQRGRWDVKPPFTYCNEYGMGYDTIGLEEVNKSPFRYCQIEQYTKGSTAFEFLVAASIYPRQIEMLMKAGMKDVVRDLVDHGVKNAAAMDWSKENPVESFGLSRQELQTFLGLGTRNIKVIELYKKLKRKVTMEECAAWASSLCYKVGEPLHQAKRWGIPPERLLRYLDGQVGCKRYGGYSTLSSVLEYWKDYVDAAEKMGYQLHRQNVLLPKNLSSAHDKATRERQAQLDRERAEARREWEKACRRADAEAKKKMEKAKAAYEQRRGKLEKRYAYAADGYIIRVPANGDEILDEGRVLKHCVAGYADRHIAGKTTILFMRKAKKPNTPWLTIEMNGAELVQIHGFRNEGEYTTKGRFAPDPRVKYADFLDPWLAWVKAGSKRTKDGKPKVPKKKKEENAA